MARRANLKKDIKGPMKMKKGSFLEPNKELKFGGVSKYKEGGSKSFNQAFAEARKAGKKTFEWNGKSYGTRRSGESQEQYRAALAKNSNNATPKENTGSAVLKTSPYQSNQAASKDRSTYGNRASSYNTIAGATPATGGKGRSVSTLLSALDNTKGSSSKTSESSSKSTPSSSSNSSSGKSITKTKSSEATSSNASGPASASKSKKEKRSRADRLNDRADRIRNRPAKKEARKEERQAKRDDRKAAKNSKRSEVKSAKANLKAARRGNMTDRRKSSGYTDAQANAVERAAKRPMKKGGKY